MQKVYSSLLGRRHMKSLGSRKEGSGFLGAERQGVVLELGHRSIYLFNFCMSL